MFTSPNGGPMRSSSITKWTKKLMEEAGLGHAQRKALRSSHGTLLAASGKVSVKEAADRLGHDPVVLMRRYWGKLTDRERAVADAFPEVLGYKAVTNTGINEAS